MDVSSPLQPPPAPRHETQPSPVPPPWAPRHETYISPVAQDGALQQAGAHADLGCPSLVSMLAAAYR